VLGPSSRDAEELLAERGVEVDHVTVDRASSTSSSANAAMPVLHGHCFIRMLGHSPQPVEVSTDRAPVYPRMIDDLVPAARHVLEQ
jgi:transposase-like protein